MGDGESGRGEEGGWWKVGKMGGERKVEDEKWEKGLR